MKSFSRDTTAAAAGGRGGLWSSGPLLGGGAGLLFVTGGLWGVLELLSPGGGSGELMCVSLALLGLLVGGMFFTGNIWAVARQTFAQCLRMRIAAVFIVLLGVSLAVLPSMLKGDGTLAGQVRTFLSYSLSATAALLTIVTIFLAVGVMSSDVRKKQIYTLVTKPLARWQYVLGRWLGIVMLDALLLAMAGVAIYGSAQYLRARPSLSVADRRALETEIFTARVKVPPQPLDVDKEVMRRITQLRNEGGYDNAVESFQTNSRVDRKAAQELLVQEIRKQVTEAAQAADPGQYLAWQFSDIRVAGTEWHGEGRVLQVRKDKGLMKLAAEPRLVARMVQGGPVTVGGTLGRAEKLADDFFIVQLPMSGTIRAAALDAPEGAVLEIMVEPTIQLSYKGTFTTNTDEKIYASLWQMVNPATGFQYVEQRSDPGGAISTITASAHLVDGKGRVNIACLNPPGSRKTLTILQQDVSVLYGVGRFEDNFFRGLLLLVVQMMFLAAMGVLAGSFLSFPVGCICAFVMLPVGFSREFIMQAIGWYSDTSLSVVSMVVMKVGAVLLPDLTKTLPADSLIDGLYIPWRYVGSNALLVVGICSLLLLSLACLICQKREMGRVQV